MENKAKHILNPVDGQDIRREKEALEIISQTKCIKCKREWSTLAPLSYVFLVNGKFLWWHWDRCVFKDDE